jgi:hypothetical protein
MDQRGTGHSQISHYQDPIGQGDDLECVIFIMLYLAEASALAQPVRRQC